MRKQAAAQASCGAKMPRSRACFWNVSTTPLQPAPGAKKDRQCLEIVTFEANDFDYK
jgi:hypothetical protein